ncbi:MAG TPA: V4R domain-containing protein [Candidatus Limnocylindrales bacterium]|nr:V4R domain-containing protein [Candidatus Limnocylindrales bacterium]
MTEQQAQLGEQVSGLTYPNRFGRAFLLALLEVVGETGFSTLMERINAPYDRSTLPPDDMERSIDFALLGALNQALDEVYGARGGRGMALRAGRAWLVKGLNRFGALSGIDDPAFRTLPADERVRIALKALASIFTHFTDQRSEIEETPASFRFTVENSPLAWGITSERPVCQALVGLLQETARWAANGREYVVREVECRACGASLCTFVVSKQVQD